MRRFTIKRHEHPATNREARFAAYPQQRQMGVQQQQNVGDVTMVVANGQPGVEVDCVGTSSTPVRLVGRAISGTSSPNTPQPATLQGTIYVDPQNVTGVASDVSPPNVVPTAGGAGGYTQAGPIFRTWTGLVAQWGTFSPVLNVATSVIFLSSHTDNSDPVIWTPIVRNQITCAIVCNPTFTALAGVLAATAAKNRAAGANQQLVTTLGAASTRGTRIRNGTHASDAWIETNQGGNAWSITQPMSQIPAVTGAPATYLPQSGVPSEVDTWANGDSVTVWTPINVNVAVFAPLIVDQLVGGASNFGQLLNVTIFDPQGVNFDTVFLGNVVAVGCSFQKKVVDYNGPAAQATSTNASTLILANCFFAAAFDYGYAGVLRINGGAITGGGTVQGGGIILDGDVVVEAVLNLLEPVAGSILGFVCCQISGSVSVQGGIISAINGFYGGHAVYAASVAGAGAVTFNGNARLNYTGTATASFTAPNMVVGVTLNGVQTATSHTGASPDVLNQVTTTVAHIDAAAGATGFGGVGIVFGGAEFANAT